MKEIFAVMFLVFVSVLLGLSLGVESYQEEYKFYNKAQELRYNCEKDLPRSEECVLIYLTEDEIRTLGKDMPSE